MEPTYRMMTDRGRLLGEGGPTLAACRFFACLDGWVWSRLSYTQEGRCCEVEAWPAFLARWVAEGNSWRPAHA